MSNDQTLCPPRDKILAAPLSALSPTVVLGRDKPRLATLSFLPLYSLETEWNPISVTQWPRNYSDTDVEHFWSTVVQHTDASGDHDFLELGNFALSLLAMPFSNAAVERVFSQMNLIKNKLRNRMQQGMMWVIFLH